MAFTPDIDNVLPRYQRHGGKADRSGVASVRISNLDDLRPPPLIDRNW